MKTIFYGIKIPFEITEALLKGKKLLKQYDVDGIVYIGYEYLHNSESNIICLDVETTHELNNITNNEDLMKDLMKEYESVLKTWADSNVDMPEKLDFNWFII